ncbi:trp operon leader peptide [Streptomyces sp. NPDC006170]|uniref:trp operon leader peptide n=1 Tax=Streptomyces sp. NPDC006170 TaxID=3154469 RepID=UPI0033A0BAED
MGLTKVEPEDVPRTITDDPRPHTLDKPTAPFAARVQVSPGWQTYNLIFRSGRGASGARPAPSTVWTGPRFRARPGYSARMYAHLNQDWWWTAHPAAH